MSEHGKSKINLLDLLQKRAPSVETQSGGSWDDLLQKYGVSRNPQGEQEGDSTSSQWDALMKKYGTATKEEVDAIGEKYSTGSDMSNQTDAADKIAALRRKYGYQPKGDSASGSSDVRPEISALRQKYGRGSGSTQQADSKIIEGTGLGSGIVMPTQQQADSVMAQVAKENHEEATQELKQLRKDRFASWFDPSSRNPESENFKTNKDWAEEIKQAKDKQDKAAQTYYELKGRVDVGSLLQGASASDFSRLVEIGKQLSDYSYESRMTGAADAIAPNFHVTKEDEARSKAVQKATTEKRELIDKLTRAGHDKETVEKALDYMMEQYEAIRAGQVNEEFRAFADAYPVAGTLLRVAAAPAQGVDYATAALGNIGHNSTANLENYKPLTEADFTFTGVTQGLTEGASADMGNIGKFLYNTGMSIADSALLVSTIGPAASVALGMGAASNTAKDVIERGGTNNQAFAAGLAAGAAEVIFEKVSIDNLLKIKNVTDAKVLVSNVLKQAGTEASEEALTEIANIISDAAIMGQGSSFNTAVKAYQKQGMSEEAAKQKAVLDNIAQIGLAAAGGALSGGVMGGGVSAVSYAGNLTQKTVETESGERLSVDDKAGSAASDNDITDMEVKNNGREEEVPVSGVGQRLDSKSPGGEERGMAGKAETAQSGDDDGEPADRGAGSLLYGGKVSTANYGIEGGSNTRNLRTVRGGESEATKAAKQIAEENGLAITLFGGGNLKLTDKNGAEYEARAYVEDVPLLDSVLAAKGSVYRGKTARAYVRADHPLFTAEQLTKHEVGHRMITRREINPDTVRARVADTFGAERVEQLAQMYAEAYEGSGLTPAQIWIEVTCDAIANMNIFSAKANVLPAVKSTETEMTTEGVAAEENQTPGAEIIGETSRETKPVSVTEEQGAELDATREAVRATVREELDRLGKEYGWLKAGEAPSRTVELPKQTSDGKKVSQTVRTVMEAQATPDALLPTLEQMVADGEFSREVYGDETAVNDANEYISNRGWSDAQREWFKAMEKGEVSKRNTAVGWTLYNNAVNSGDTEGAIDILNAMVEHQRNAAQALQATRILKKMSPETQLYAVQKSIGRLQQELNDRYGSKKKGAPKITIDPALAGQVLNAPDQQARDEALKQIYRNVGKQLPSNFVDKWNAWRYLAMLGNPRTWGRNIIGNAMFSPVVATKNLTATVIESIVNRVSGGKTTRSKALVTGATESDRALLSAAWGDYANVENAVMGVGKYGDFALANKQIEEGRQIFGRVEQAKTGVGKVVSGTLGKAVEAARKGTTRVMVVGDQWFSKPHYTSALASYCKANGITAEQIQKGEGLDEARAYAVKEAQKATYRDANMFSDAISQLGRYKGNNPFRKGLSVALEGILPFRRTPANILARGVEYSPAGIAKTLTYDIYKVKKGDMTAAELIDDLSAGLTGSGLMALGVFLAAQGLIRGHGGGDEKEKEFEELMGHQAYALEVGDTSITLDWLAPEVLPFFVGVNLWEATGGGEKPATMADMLSAIGLVTEPLLEMSCLQSLNDAFEAVRYAEADGMDYLPAVLASAVTSYLTQAIPALSGQLERIGQEERMATYTTKGNDNLTTDMQYTVGSASSKLPGFDFQQIPYIDAWGRTEDSGSVGERLLDNMFNPAYVSTIETSDMEAELERLYNETGEKKVFPSRADKYLTVGGERVDLTADQYVKYAEAKGQTAYDLLSELTASKGYSAMSDTDRVEVVGWAYDYANAVAKTKVSSYKLDGWIEKAERAAANGVPVVDYLLYKQAVVEASTDGNTNTSQAEAEAALIGMTELTDEQRAFLWQSTNSSWKEDKNPFK